MDRIAYNSATGFFLVHFLYNILRQNTHALNIHYHLKVGGGQQDKKKKVFFKDIWYSPRLHLFDQSKNNSKNINIIKNIAI